MIGTGCSVGLGLCNNAWWVNVAHCITVTCVGGRFREEDGAWFRDESLWRSSLERMYEQLMVEHECFSSTTSRLRRGSGWR